MYTDKQSFSLVLLNNSKQFHTVFFSCILSHNSVLSEKCSYYNCQSGSCTLHDGKCSPTKLPSIITEVSEFHIVTTALSSLTSYSVFAISASMVHTKKGGLVICLACCLAVSIAQCVLYQFLCVGSYSCLEMWFYRQILEKEADLLDYLLICLLMQAILCSGGPRLSHSPLHHQLTMEYKCLLKTTYTIDFLKACWLVSKLMKLHRIKTGKSQRAGIRCGLSLFLFTCMNIVNMLRFKLAL